MSPNLFRRNEFDCFIVRGSYQKDNRWLCLADGLVVEEDAIILIQDILKGILLIKARHIKDNQIQTVAAQKELMGHLVQFLK